MAHRVTFGQKPAAQGKRLFPKIDRTPIADENSVSRWRPSVVSKSRPTGPYQVQGQKASDLEARVYRMLKQLGWSDDSIQFQVSILGGRKPGGQVLDFVLYGPGATYVINVNGDYWHKFGEKYNEAVDNAAKAQAVMPSARITTVYTADVIDDATALVTLNRLVGRGMYALAEWGYKAGVAREVIEDIIKKEGPLSKDDIVDSVMKERYFKKNTILVNLANPKYFKKNKAGLYILA